MLQDAGRIFNLVLGTGINEIAVCDERTKLMSGCTRHDPQLTDGLIDNFR